MYRSFAALVLLTAALGAAPAAAAAQEPAANIVEVQLRDGSRLLGSIVSRGSERIVLKLVSGAKVTIAEDQVKSIAPGSGLVVGGELRTDDVVSSRLFLGPTGRSLARGEGYIAIDSLLLPMFQVGVTDRFSLGVGAPFYGFTGTAWITPKFQMYRSDRTAVATGVLHLFAPDFGVGGYGYVAATRGTPTAAVTFGGGVLYGRDDHERHAVPMFSIGGERQFGRRTKLVTENYIFQGGVIASAGVRLIGQRVSTELGLLVPITEGEPIVGFFFNFVFHSRPKAVR